MITYTAKKEGDGDWRGNVVDDCGIIHKTRYTYPSYEIAERAAKRWWDWWDVKRREFAA